MSKAITRRPLSPVARARQGMLADILADVAEGDLGVATASQKGMSKFVNLDEAMAFYDKARKMTPEELQAQGWGSIEEVRIAVHAQKNSKDAPYGLVMSQRRAELRWRDGAGEQVGQKGSGYVIPAAAAKKKSEP